jgi:hypothetical protein
MMAIDNLEKILRLVTPELCEDMIVAPFSIATISENVTLFPGVRGLVLLATKMEKNPLHPSSSHPSPSPSPDIKRKVVKAGPVSTSTKQITAYTTLNGIYSETGVRGHQYSEFAVKELTENSYDFLQVIYPVEKGNTKETRKIAIHAKIEPIPSVIKSISNPLLALNIITHIIRITVRNSNIDNKTVFENLEAIFDYDSWYSTKRNQYRITTGALGDFLKRSLGMGYALWTSDFNPEDSLEERQWDEPAIFRFNGQERRVYIKVEPGQKVMPQFDTPTKYDTSGFTEVEIALPIATEWKRSNCGYNDLISRLENYCKRTRLSKIKTEITFTFDRSVEG